MTLPLPVKDGVNPSTTFLPEGEWPTVLDFLCEKFVEVSPTIWQSRMERKEVVSESGQVIYSKTAYLPKQRIYYYRELNNEFPIPFEEQLLYENDDILVVDKPHFLPVVPSGGYLHQTLLVRLRKKTGIDELSPAHRLDRLTAGVVLFTKCQKTRHLYQQLFANRQMKKTYLAISKFKPDAGLKFPMQYESCIVNSEHFFKMKIIDGKVNSKTKITYLGEVDQGYQFKLQPETGKKHQLRVQMAALGLPLLNDPLYPEILPYQNQDFSNPLKLLARELSFIDPICLQEFKFTSDLSI